MSISKFRWCEDVCSYVRFWPDREAIRRELLAHIEDGQAELTASGMAKKEAEGAVLARMGSTKEVGLALDAVHKPGLGWLWMVSKGLMLLALAGVLILFLTAPNRLGLELEDLSGASLSDSVGVWGCTDYSDGYLFSIDQAAFWENGDPNDGLGTVKLKLTVWDLMGNGSLTASTRFYLVDSQGETHLHTGAWSEGDGTGQPFVTEGYFGILRETHILTLDDVPLGLQWVELRYTDYGRGIVLRVELPGGEDA